MTDDTTTPTPEAPLANPTTPTGSAMPIQPATDERHDTEGRIAGVDLEPDPEPDADSADAKTAADKADDAAAAAARKDAEKPASANRPHSL